MECNQLGGPDSCNHEFHAETWEEMMNLSKKHGMEMGEKGDQAHLGVMEKMKEKMNDPEEMHKWMKERQEEFNSLAD